MLGTNQIVALSTHHVSRLSHPVLSISNLYRSTTTSCTVPTTFSTSPRRRRKRRLALTVKTSLARPLAPAFLTNDSAFLPVPKCATERRYTSVSGPGKRKRGIARGTARLGTLDPVDALLLLDRKRGQEIGMERWGSWTQKIFWLYWKRNRRFGPGDKILCLLQEEQQDGAFCTLNPGCSLSITGIVCVTSASSPSHSGSGPFKILLQQLAGLTAVASASASALVRVVVGQCLVCPTALVCCSRCLAVSFSSGRRGACRLLSLCSFFGFGFFGAAG